MGNANRRFRVKDRTRFFADLLVPLCAGALTVLAFAPFGWWPVQIATLTLIFRLVQRRNSIRQSALVGWAYGFGWAACGVHWLYVSMHRYGGMASWMAALAVVLFSLCLGAFAASATGIAAWLQKRWRSPAAVTLLLILPSLWSLAEWLRGWIFTGFPWVVSGYAHSTGALAGLAPIVGVYGIGWCAAFIAGCFAVCFDRTARFRIGALLFALAVLAAGTVAAQFEWTAPAGKPITVRLLQGNVPQEMKFSASQVEKTLALYHDMIGAQAADLIATPETAIPVLLQQLPPDYLPLLQKRANQSGSHLLLGVPVFDGPQAYTNSVIGLAPAAAGTLRKPYRYDKHHLVPFGEFVPPGFRWFVNLMRIPLGDFSRGDAVQPAFAVKDQRVLPNICYEDLFGEEIADQIAADHFAGKPTPTILLNLSNIAWFGDTIALPQHLQISQMRSLETGRPMLRSTNTGTTAAIDHRGRVAARLEPYTRATLAATVQGYQGATPYILYGNTSFLILALCMLVIAGLASKYHRRMLDWS